MLRAYGLRIECPLPLPGADGVTGRPDVTVTMAESGEQLAAGFSGDGDADAVQRRVDQLALDYARGPDGDVLVTWSGGKAGSWLIAPDADAVLAHAPSGTPTPAWTRLLLDSILATVAFKRGAVGLHAGGVVLGAGAVAVLGGTGGGKSSLVAALVARGHPLLCDDILVLTQRGGAPAGWPSPPVMNLATERPWGPDVAALGHELARIGDEVWVQVRSVATEPVALRAIVLLDRRADGPRDPVLVAAARGFEQLLAHALPTGSVASRERDRFAALGAVVDGVPVLRLSAGLNHEPPALADALETL